MDINAAHYKTYFFESIEKIPQHFWNFLEKSNSSYFKKAFLKPIDTNHKNIEFVYSFLVDEKENPVAFNAIKIIDFYLDTVNNTFDVFLNKIKDSVRKLHLLPIKKPLKILISGNIFVSGEHGIYIKKEIDKKIIFKWLVKSIHNYVNEKKNLQIDAFLIKDFKDESLSITNALKKYHYHPFLVEPNMVMKIDENWSSFSDYLQALRTKFRVKANKALTLSSQLRIEKVTVQNIDYQIQLINELYNKVANKASFNLAKFNVNSYINLKNAFGNHYILKTFWLEKKMVGFMSGIINQNQLDAHFVGLDYSYNKEHAVYQKMLYEYINIAIKLKLAQINFGRTASEIKSSVGAKPVNLTMYLRHKKGFTNQILKLFLQRVQPTPFKQKEPFKLIVDENN